MSTNPAFCIARAQFDSNYSRIPGSAQHPESSCGGTLSERPRGVDVSTTREATASITSRPRVNISVQHSLQALFTRDILSKYTHAIANTNIAAQHTSFINSTSSIVANSPSQGRSYNIVCCRAHRADQSLTIIQWPPPTGSPTL